VRTPTNSNLLSTPVSAPEIPSPIFESAAPPATPDLPGAAKTKTPRHRILSGSATMLGGLVLVTLINFAYNIAVARFLGPTAFGHTTAVYTLLILISSVTLSFQILTAKIVAQQRATKGQTVAYKAFHRRGWAAGIVVGVLLFVFRGAVTTYLHLPDTVLVELLAIGTIFYVPLGARRGYIQGTCNFRALAYNLVLEGFVRLGGSLLAIGVGAGVSGVIAANAGAVVLAYFFAQPRLPESEESGAELPVAFRESLQAAVFFAGQVVINNCDIVVVKHFFPSEVAGVYAAIAMVGRVVFAFSWAVVSSMFPIAAERSSQHPQEENEDHQVLGISLLLVLAICLVFAVGLFLAPATIWSTLFGKHFTDTGGGSFSRLLMLYAVSTGIYALSVVVIAYEMSRKIANTGWVQLLMGSVVVAGIYLFHGSIAQVIWVQIITMLILLLCVAVPFVFTWARKARAAAFAAPPGFIELRRRASEDEVIAEFLKNDFQCPEYEEYQTSAQLVLSPDLDNERDNRVRRALLFVRHGSLWRELPAGTQWFEAEIRKTDLPRIRVFPRAHWRKLAVGDFAITQVAQRMADEEFRGRTSESFREKIEDLRDHLQEENKSMAGAVLLIGVNESGPFTILDGNHRLLAAILAGTKAVDRLQFFCGLSPHMARCCWYRTNLATLSRYAGNMIRYVIHDPDKDLIRLLQNSQET
jgi:O-antigen/teichoic acid export membrane protein